VLADAKVPANVEGEFNRYYRAALDAAYEGKWVDARGDLARASTLFPNSPDLIRFRSDTDRAIKALPLWRLHPVWTSIIIGALALLFATLLIVVTMSRRARFPKDLMTSTTDTKVVAPTGRDSDGNGHGVLPPGSPLLLGRFTILNGTRAGEKLGLGGSGIRIGRESTICEIVLENPKVSRLHAEVVSIDGKVLLIDRNSSNGTYVNDQKIDKRFLKDGDIIYFGGRNAVAVAFHA
jgi:hypothetical protein